MYPADNYTIIVKAVRDGRDVDVRFTPDPADWVLHWISINDVLKRAMNVELQAKLMDDADGFPLPSDVETPRRLAQKVASVLRDMVRTGHIRAQGVEVA